MQVSEHALNDPHLPLSIAPVPVVRYGTPYVTELQDAQDAQDAGVSALKEL